MSGCSTCGYIGGMDMMTCNKHCRPCHIYCSCPESFDEVMEVRDRLKSWAGYAGTLYDHGRATVPEGKVLP